MARPASRNDAVVFSRTSVQFQPEADWGAEGGWWCDSDGPAATYTWAVSGNTLTLAPVGGKDGSHQRGTTWTGAWTRVK